MAQANITVTPFSGRTQEDFNQFEELLRAVIGVAGWNCWTALRKLSTNNALSFFQQLPAAVRADLDQSLAALRTRFIINELQEIQEQRYWRPDCRKH